MIRSFRVLELAAKARQKPGTGKRWERVGVREYYDRAASPGSKRVAFEVVGWVCSLTS